MAEPLMRVALQALLAGDEQLEVLSHGAQVAEELEYAVFCVAPRLEERVHLLEYQENLLQRAREESPRGGRKGGMGFRNFLQSKYICLMKLVQRVGSAGIFHETGGAYKCATTRTPVPKQTGAAAYKDPPRLPRPLRAHKHQQRQWCETRRLCRPHSDVHAQPYLLDLLAGRRRRGTSEQKLD